MLLDEAGKVRLGILDEGGQFIKGFPPPKSHGGAHGGEVENKESNLDLLTVVNIVIRLLH